MASSYDNFGVANTPIGLPTTSYGSFGVVNSNLNGLSTIPNIVTESVSPTALNSGVLSGDINSANYKTGVSGWKIFANGNAEFQQLTGVSFTGITITGSTINGGTINGTTITAGIVRTSSGNNRVQFNSSNNDFEGYFNGILKVAITGNGGRIISFDDSGNFSSQIEGVAPGVVIFDTSEAVGASTSGMRLSTSDLNPTSATMGLGSAANPWAYAYIGEIGDNSNKVTVHCSGLSACPLPVTENALEKLSLVRHTKLEPGVGHYGDEIEYVNIPDAPDEMKITMKDGSKDIDIVKTTAFLYSCIKELKSELDMIKSQYGQNGKIMV